MTLVLYIPFAEGSIIISDRQNTNNNDIAITREPVDKIHALPNFNGGLGFSGSTAKCRHIVDKLQRVQNLNSFEDSYRTVFAFCYGSRELGFHVNDLELLVVTKQIEGTFKVRKIYGGLTNEIDETKCSAMGSGAVYIQPQLDVNTNNVDREAAEDFGKALIKYAALIDGTVGDPVSYGYNVLLMNATNNDVQTIHPETVNISKLLYDFET